MKEDEVFKRCDRVVAWVMGIAIAYLIGRVLVSWIWHV